MFDTIWPPSATALVTKQCLIMFGQQTFQAILPEFYTTCFCILSAVKPQVIQIMRDLYQQYGN